MTSIVNPGDGMSAVGMSMTRRLAMFSDRLRGRTPDSATGMTAAPDASHGRDNGQEKDPAPASPGYAIPAPATPSGQQLAIEIEDWDLMFAAVRARLIHAVGQRLGELPNVPGHSAELSASLVQAVVLDCVTEMDKLHASLKRQRSQRLTP